MCRNRNLLACCYKVTFLGRVLSMMHHELHHIKEHSKSQYSIHRWVSNLRSSISRSCGFASVVNLLFIFNLLGICVHELHRLYSTCNHSTCLLNSEVCISKITHAEWSTFWDLQVWLSLSMHFILLKKIMILSLFLRFEKISFNSFWSATQYFAM